MFGDEKTPGGEQSHPVKIVIDFLEGTTRKSEAIAFARSFIESHFEAPDSAGWYVTPYQDGYVFEVQEGGENKAYLPAIMKALDEDPSVTVVVPMSRRMLEVKRLPSGAYGAILLPEGMESTAEHQTSVYPSGSLTPFRRNGMGLFLTGGLIFAIATVFFLLSFLFFLLDPYTISTPLPKATDPDRLPIHQWDKLTKSKTKEYYVKTLISEDGRRYRIERTKTPEPEKPTPAPTEEMRHPPEYLIEEQD
ncbi:MAG: hypothetical protein U9N14_02325 [Pseudomonadota bacterium]|nr:hypothetical protein [Pseudomonadota bacterium]